MSDSLFQMNNCSICGRAMTSDRCVWCDPVLPYAGTSGHSGSDTSRERAERDDSSGKTRARQMAVLRHLAAVAEHGCTWSELADTFGWHHGQASGALSVLHKAGEIARLRNKRGRSAVYCLPQYVHGRDTAQQGGKPKLCDRCLNEIEEVS